LERPQHRYPTTFGPASNSVVPPKRSVPVLKVWLYAWASTDGHEAVARLLIDKGADVKAQDKDGSTALIK
jgi:hypothetical protein